MFPCQSFTYYFDLMILVQGKDSAFSGTGQTLTSAAASVCPDSLPPPPDFTSQRALSPVQQTLGTELPSPHVEVDRHLTAHQLVFHVPPVADGKKQTPVGCVSSYLS